MYLRMHNEYQLLSTYHQYSDWLDLAGMEILKVFEYLEKYLNLSNDVELHVWMMSKDFLTAEEG